jgi:hypothetical protein
VALLAERRAYLDDHADELDGDGRRLVVGNGSPGPVGWSPPLGRSRWPPLGLMTAGRGAATGR